MFQLSALPYRVEWPEGNTKTLVTTGEQFEAMLSQLQANRLRIFDHETSGLEWMKHSESCGIGLGCFDNGVKSWYVPYRHRTGEAQLDIETVRKPLQQLFADPYATNIAHHLKFDEHMNRKEGWHIGGQRYCTLTAARLSDENKSIKLKHRAALDLGHTWAGAWEERMDAEVRRLGKARNMKKKAYMRLHGYSETPINLCGLYGCYDVDFTGQLYSKYEREGLSSTYSRVWSTEMALLEALCDMEEVGCPIDVEYLHNLGIELTRVTDGLLHDLTKMFGSYMFNIGSDIELRRFLYETLRIPATTMTKKGNLPSVDGDVLAFAAQFHPAIPLISEWREAEKIRTTWTSSILDKLDANNVLHGQLNNAGTTTGRASSNAPNLQNFANDSDDRAVRLSGRSLEDGGIDPWSVRRAFVARRWPNGTVIPRLIFDYSQIELKVIAHYTKDPVMNDAFLKGQDIHQRTQVEVGAILGGGPAPRRVAKITNFGISYCMTAMGLARQAKIPMEQAEQFLAAFERRYAIIPAYREAFWANVRFQGCQFVNIWGRPRRLPNMISDVPYIRRRAQRQAFGTLIQGTAAELIKESIVRIHRFLKAERLPAWLVSTVHDELWVDCCPSCLSTVIPKVKQFMEDYHEFDPLKPTVGGEIMDTNWAEKRELAI